MDLDDELCLCFHVTTRKVINFIRVENPKRAAQLSDCYGAGTGCGWCRPFLKELFEAVATDDVTVTQLPDTQDYARGRTRYVRTGRGTPPPGATPIDHTHDPMTNDQ